VSYITNRVSHPLRFPFVPAFSSFSRMILHRISHCSCVDRWNSSNSSSYTMFFFAAASYFFCFAALVLDVEGAAAPTPGAGTSSSMVTKPEKRSSAPSV